MYLTFFTAPTRNTEISLAQIAGTIISCCYLHQHDQWYISVAGMFMVNYGKCSKIPNTLLSLFSTKTVVISLLCFSQKAKSAYLWQSGIEIITKISCSTQTSMIFIAHKIKML